MIPILYEKGETNFKHNGIGRLTEAISCEVEQSRNDKYELTLTYPMTGRHYDDIIKGIEDNNGEYGRVVYVTHDATGKPQPFDLYKHTAPMNGLVTFYGHHVSYRLSKQVLLPFTAFSAEAAFSHIAENVVGGTNFTFSSDKTTLARMQMTAPRSVKQQLGGVQGSMLDVYNGGDYEFDHFNVVLHGHLGVDSGVEIRYGKNLTDISQDYDTSECYNAVVPYWTNSETGQTVMLPTYVVSKHEQLGQDMHAVPLDLSSDFDSEPTTQQLSAAALSYLNKNQPWIPDENLRVEFEAQLRAGTYDNVAPLQQVNLLDTVDVIYPKLGINAVKKRVIRTVYDGLRDRYKLMELGQPTKSIFTAIADSVEGAVLNVVPTRTEVQKQLDNATAQITGAKDSHIRFLYDEYGGLQEIVIIDTEDITTARKVWRMNSGGFGHSSTGYNGPYTTAITQDGQIVADVIKTGILTDAQGKSFWNFLTGVLQIEGTFLSKSTRGGTTYTIEMSGGAITFKKNNVEQGSLYPSDGAFNLVGADGMSINLWTDSRQRDGASVTIDQNGNVTIYATKLGLECDDIGIGPVDDMVTCLTKDDINTIDGMLDVKNGLVRGYTPDVGTKYSGSVNVLDGSMTVSGGLVMQYSHTSNYTGAVHFVKDVDFDTGIAIDGIINISNGAITAIN